MDSSTRPRTSPSGNPSSIEQLGSRLDSWKEIAAYLGRSEKTVRRWEDREGLPVHRLHHQRGGSVYVIRASWIRGEMCGKWRRNMKWLQVSLMRRLAAAVPRSPIWREQMKIACQNPRVGL